MGKGSSRAIMIATEASLRSGHAGTPSTVHAGARGLSLSSERHALAIVGDSDLPAELAVIASRSAEAAGASPCTT